jgi:hypothetical protein
MDLSAPEFSYVFLVIPVLFAFAVFVQGLTKLFQNAKDGPMETGFGAFLLLLIIVAWAAFIR